MKKQPILDPEEMLRMCGLQDEEVSNISWLLKDSLSDDLHHKKITDIVALLEEVLSDFRMLRTFDIGKIRQIARQVENIVTFQERKTEDVLNEIENNQELRSGTEYSLSLRVFPTLMRASMGLDKGFYLLTADPNVGKTAFLCQLANDLLMSNDGDSVKVLLISLDDDKDDILKRLIANMTYLINHDVGNASTINATNRATDFYCTLEKKWKVNPKARELKKIATTIVRENIKSGRLHITDSNLCLNGIRNAVIEAGAKNLVVLIDGAYNIKTELIGNERDDYLSEGIKRLVRDFKCPFFCVKELKKPEGRRKSVSMHDIKGSMSWSYNATFIVSLTKEEGGIKMFVEKNKKSDYKSKAIYYNFIPAKNIYQELGDDNF